MTTIQTADGKLLRAQRPAGAGFGSMSGGLWGPFPPLWSNGETADGDGVLMSYERIYRSQPVLSGAIDKLARRLATLPFGGYRSLPNGSREPVTDDALASLLRRPWPRASTVHLNTFVAQSLFIHGNAVVAKLRTADREQPPYMLWPLDWSQLSAYGPQGGRIEWWSTTQFDGQERFLPVEDTLHFAWPAPSGAEIGVSPLEKLGVTIRLEDAAQRYQTASFRNGVRPSIAVTLEGHPQPELVAQIRQSIEALHKGVDQNAKTLVLSGGAKVTPFSLTAVEAALIDQRRLNREEVGMVLDMAGPLMNDLTHGTYSNVAEFLKALYRDVVPPTAELVVQTYQSQLLDVEPAWLDRVVRFDFQGKLTGDPKDLAETLKVEVEAGLRTRNEARYVLGLPPDGDADDPANPANQLSANVNNQAPLAAMATGAPEISPSVSPTSRE